MKNELVELSVAQIKSILDQKDTLDDFFVFRASTEEHFLESRSLRLRGFTMILCTNGTENGTINIDQVRIEEGSLLMSFPNNVIRIEKGEPKANVRGIIISQEFISNLQVDIKNSVPLFMQLVYNPLLKLTHEQQSTIERYLDLLENISNDTSLKHRNQIVGGLLLSLFYQVSNMYDQSSQMVDHSNRSVRNRREEYFAKFIKLLSENFKRERTVGFYADQMCVTPKYLSLLIKEYSGRSAAEWIDNYVIIEAQTLLRYSTMSIQEVAYTLNFSSQSFFGKYFKHLTGMSPSEYKLSHCKE